MTTVCFDVETTTRNKGNPFTDTNRMVSYSVKVNDNPASFNYYDAIDFLEELRAEIGLAKLIVGFNLKFDLNWATRYGIHPPDRCRIWDCQIAEFIISGQQNVYPSLNECLDKYGLSKKDDKIAEYWDLGIDTTEIPREELGTYNDLDVELTYQLYLKQQEVMTEKQKRLTMLSGLDLLVLQEMEQNGIKFDIELCKTKEQEVAEKLAVINTELLQHSPTARINLDSGQQLSCLLYGGKFEIEWVDHVTEEVYKSGKKKGEAYLKNHYKSETFECEPIFKPLPKTKYKLPLKVGTDEIPVYQAGEDILRQLRATSKVQKRIIELLLARAEYAKLLDTYYGKLPTLLETMGWGNYLHGQYNQVVVATGRLSSSGPNMQNFSGPVDALLISRYEN